MVDRSNSERLRGFGNGLTDRWTDICDCRVAFATENSKPDKSNIEIFPCSMIIEKWRFTARRCNARPMPASGRTILASAVSVVSR